MTTASCPFATALWGARFAGVWLPSCYTTWGDTISASHARRSIYAITGLLFSVMVASQTAFFVLYQTPSFWAIQSADWFRYL